MNIHTILWISILLANLQPAICISAICNLLICHLPFAPFFFPSCPILPFCAFLSLSLSLSVSLSLSFFLSFFFFSFFFFFLIGAQGNPISSRTILCRKTSNRRINILIFQVSNDDPMRRGLLLSRHGGIRPLLDRLLQQRTEPAYLCVLQPWLPRGLQGHADERPAVLCELLENPVRVRLAKETPVNSRVEQAVFCDPQMKSVSIHSSSDRPICCE